MSWAAVDTKLLTKPAIRQLPTPTHKLLWLAGRLHCGDFETDGLIEAAALPLLAFVVDIDVDQARQLVLSLQETGLWKPHQKGWIDTTFLDENPSHEVRERGRARDRDKKKRLRARPVSPGDGTGGRHRGTAPGDDPGDDPGGVPKAQIQNRDSTKTETGISLVSVTPSPHSADAELARSNGHGKALPTTALTDVDRHARISSMLDETVKGCRFLAESVEKRWLAQVAHLVPKLVSRSDLRESTIQSRAKRFFLSRYWCHLCDADQVSHLADHMLAKVDTHTKAAKR